MSTTPDTPSTSAGGTDRPVRAERPEDAPAVRRINLAAFGAADEADLVDALREDEKAWLPEFSRIAEDGSGTPVGHALLTRCHVGGIPALALAPCAVLPAHQNTGIGSATVRSALETARAAGEDAVVVLGHAAYYPRFGFTPCSRAGIIPPPGQDWPDEAFLVLSLRGDHDGLPRGTVRYARAFGI